MSKEQVKAVKLNATVMWAFLDKPYKDNEKCSVEFANLSDAAVDALEAQGIEVKKDPKHPEKGFFIRCYSTNPIRAYDETGTIIPNDIKVGNGSKAVVVVSPYEHEFKKKKMVLINIKRFIITDLIQYVPVDSFDDSDLPVL